MAKNIPLGRVERIDLRGAWPHEALNFTPWLAEHLDDPARAIGGFDLELGAYRAGKRAATSPAQGAS